MTALSSTLCRLCHLSCKSTIRSSFFTNNHFNQPQRMPHSSIGRGDNGKAEVIGPALSGSICIFYERGLPIFRMPLPSRNEVCQFTFRPITETVGDICHHVSVEDRGIEHVAVYTHDGIRVANSTPVEHLLQMGSFRLRINDKVYNAEAPSLANNTDGAISQVSSEQIRSLNNIQATIEALHATLNVDEYKARREKALLIQLEHFNSQIRPLQDIKAKIEEESHRRSDRMLWFGLFGMGVQIGIFGRLTWWEYSWDIMEPVTYFTTLSTMIISYAYYLLTRRPYEYEVAKDRMFQSHFHRRANKYGFDQEKFNQLQNNIIRTEDDLSRIRDPFQQYLSVSRLASILKQKSISP